MSAVYSLSNSAIGSLLLVLTSANMIAFVSLLGEASSGYLAKKVAGGHASKLRLQLARTLLIVVSIAAGIKVVMETKLANDLIAAWFVGQGFALQTIIRNVIEGIVARHDTHVREIVVEKGGTVVYNKKPYTATGTNIVVITLTSHDTKQYVLVLPWTELAKMELHSNQLD